MRSASPVPIELGGEFIRSPPELTRALHEASLSSVDVVSVSEV